MMSDLAKLKNFVKIQSFSIIEYKPSTFRILSLSEMKFFPVENIIRLNK